MTGEIPGGNCDGGCGRTVVPRNDFGYVSIEGWERLRSEGGQHAVRDKVRTGRVICDSCLERRIAGVENQEGLDLGTGGLG
jgi:hypothetical protein